MDSWDESDAGVAFADTVEYRGRLIFELDEEPGLVVGGESARGGSLDPVEFQREFDGADELDVSFDYSDRKLPRYTLSGGNVVAFSDASQFARQRLSSWLTRTSRDLPPVAHLRAGGKGVVL
jgi:hypothetical protein